MDPVHRIRLQWVHGGWSDASYQLLRLQFSRHSRHAWHPAINAYRCETGIRICVDLAGVEKSAIDLQIEPHHLLLRGERENPEPAAKDHQILQTIALEIDYGPFLRSIPLPAEVDPDRASAVQENGFLWITLPLKKA